MKCHFENIEEARAKPGFFYCKKFLVANYFLQPEIDAALTFEVMVFRKGLFKKWKPGKLTRSFPAASARKKTGRMIPL